MRRGEYDWSGGTAPGPARGLFFSLALALAFSASGPRAAQAEPSQRARRLPDQSWPSIFAGPFVSPRVFTMPTADVVGAYQLSARGDASLLAQTGVLSTTSAYAVGFGDIAQLEYRGEAASTTSEPVPIELFAIGAQFAAPLPDDPGWPGLALALRLGLPEEDVTTDGEAVYRFEERVTDLYLVASLDGWGWLAPWTLHGGCRIGQASIDGLDTGESSSEYLVLPAAAVEVELNERAWLATEFLMAPHFDPGTADRASAIGARPSGRLGVRWQVIPAALIDVSVGFRIESQRLDDEVARISELVGWDMRAGLELFVPWGAMLCRSGGLFCE